MQPNLSPKARRRHRKPISASDMDIRRAAKPADKPAWRGRGKVATKILGAALLAAVLGGCAGEPDTKITVPNYEIIPLPKNYKTIVIDYLKTRRKDGAAVQVGDAYQDSCRVNATGRYYGWAVPVTYGKKKRARGAMPNEIIWFNNNSVQMISSGGTGDCSKA
jgi:hypothetical protein